MGPTRMEFTIQPGQPIEWIKKPSTRPQKDSPYAPLGDTLREYRDAAKRLLETKYPELRQLVPAYLQGRCGCLAIVCDDGLVLRWDEDPEPKVRIGTASLAPGENTIEVWAPRLSERFVWCPRDATNFRLPDDGQRIQFLKIGPNALREVVSDVAFGIVVNRSQAPVAAFAAIARPLPIASVLPEMEILLHMEVFDANEPLKPGSGQEALVRQSFRLPVGWSAIEVYPKFDADTWKPEQAAAAAEIDLLGIAARHNLRESSFQAVDSRAAARREYWRLLDEFSGFLKGKDEAPLQAFLKAHPALLSPAYVKVWPKVKLGDRVTDFIVREGAGEYLLVELEAPTRQLFRGDGQQHEELTHAVNQITDWWRYLEDNLSTVQRELGLEGISTNPKALIVIGRTAGLTDADKRKLTTVRNIQPKIQILTYDDALAAAEATIANLFGPRLFGDGASSAEVYYIWNKETLPPA